MDLNNLLRSAVELGASDIHLKVGQPPILRRDGDLDPMIDPLITNDLEEKLKALTI